MPALLWMSSRPNYSAERPSPSWGQCQRQWLEGGASEVYLPVLALVSFRQEWPLPYSLPYLKPQSPSSRINGVREVRAFHQAPKGCTCLSPLTISPSKPSSLQPIGRHWGPHIVDPYVPITASFTPPAQCAGVRMMRMTMMTRSRGSVSVATATAASLPSARRHQSGTIQHLSSCDVLANHSSYYYSSWSFARVLCFVLIHHLHINL